MVLNKKASYGYVGVYFNLCIGGGQMGDIANILICGDSHLGSKNRGSHNNYPEESFYYYKYATDAAIEYKATHFIGLGDLTFGRFGTLDYRILVEKEMERRREALNGNVWEIRGNHDIATYGMTEYTFYLQKGMFRGSENLSIGNLNINMVDYGEYDNTPVNIEMGKTNFLLTHGYFRFKDTNMPPYGEALILDDYSKWFGMDYMISGHIHTEHVFSGNIIKGNEAHEMTVHYLPCNARPAYIKGGMADEGALALISIHSDGTFNYSRIEVPLWDLDKSFNLAVREKEIQHKEDTKVDVSDVVNSLDKFERVVGNPEDIIMGRLDIDIKYRKKAIELLHGV